MKKKGLYHQVRGAFWLTVLLGAVGVRELRRKLGLSWTDKNGERVPGRKS